MKAVKGRPGLVVIVAFIVALAGRFTLNRIGLDVPIVNDVRVPLLTLLLLCFALEVAHGGYSWGTGTLTVLPVHLLLAYQIISAAWSPPNAARFAAVGDLSATAVLIFVYASLADWDRDRVTRVTLGCFLAAGWIYFLAAAAGEGHSAGNRWAALGGGPNVFVRVMVLGLLATIYFYFSTGRKLYWLIGVPAFIIGALASGSRGGISALAITLAIGFLATRFRRAQPGPLVPYALPPPVTGLPVLPPPASPLPNTSLSGSALPIPSLSGSALPVASPSGPTVPGLSPPGSYLRGTDLPGSDGPVAAGIAPRKKKGNSLRTFAAIAVAGVATWFFAGDTIWSYIEERFINTTIEGGYTSDRDVLFRAAINLFWERPFLGTGVNGFYADTNFGSGERYVHDLPLAVAAEGGFVGLTFLFVAWLALWRGYMSTPRTGRTFEARAAAYCGIYVGAAGLFSGDYYDARLMWIFLLLAAVRPQRRPEPDRPAADTPGTAAPQTPYEPAGARVTTPKVTGPSR